MYSLAADLTAPMDVTDLSVFGVFVVCGLWWLSFPGSVVRLYLPLYGPRHSPRPFFIRLAGATLLAVSLWMFWAFWPRAVPR